MKKICCFTGHRIITKTDSEKIKEKLKHEISHQIESGINIFLTGGAIGFDQLAAKIILEKKYQGIQVKLICVLPCREQDKLWKSADKILYREIINNADKIIYVSELYDKDCMRRRNSKLVEIADVCVCALKNEYSGTAQTVRIAKNKGIEVINIYDKI